MIETCRCVKMPRKFSTIAELEKSRFGNFKYCDFTGKLSSKTEN
jgi:hypothetical protein